MAGYMGCNENISFMVDFFEYFFDFDALLK